MEEVIMLQHCGAPGHAAVRLLYVVRGHGRLLRGSSGSSTHRFYTSEFLLLQLLRLLCLLHLELQSLLHVKILQFLQLLLLLSLNIVMASLFLVQVALCSILQDLLLLAKASFNVAHLLPIASLKVSMFLGHLLDC